MKIFTEQARVGKRLEIEVGIKKKSEREKVKQVTTGHKALDLDYTIVVVEVNRREKIDQTPARCFTPTTIQRGR